MTSNLLIAYPQITIDATTITASSSADSTYPNVNVITGPRTNRTQLATATTTSWIKFDIGASAAKTIDYLIVARGNLLQRMGSTQVKLQGSTDDVTYTNICGVTTTYQAITLYGPRSEDAVFTSDLANSAAGTLPASVTYRYWKFFATGAADPSKTWPFSKVYFGAFFDPGHDPEIRQITRQVRKTGERESHYVLRLTWRGITDSKLNTFFSSILSVPENPVFLYSSTYNSILLSYKIMHCVVVEHDIVRLTDNSSDLTVVFEELI